MSLTPFIPTRASRSPKPLPLPSGRRDGIGVGGGLGDGSGVGLLLAVGGHTFLVRFSTILVCWPHVRVARYLQSNVTPLPTLLVLQCCFTGMSKKLANTAIA